MRNENNTEEIARILDKFMAGETSLAEEQLLADYFRTHEVSDEWREYKEMFALFDSGRVDIEQASSLPLQRASTPLHYGRGSRSVERPVGPSGGWVVGIAAAILIAFLLWPESQEPPITQPELQPVIAEASPPEPVPKEDFETETLVSESAETHQKASPVSTTKRPQMRTLLAQATAVTTNEEDAQSVILDAAPVAIENPQSSSDSAPLPSREELGLGLPSDRQALADIYLAETALQVAYQRQAQAEALRAYAASLEGEETPPAQPIIAF